MELLEDHVRAQFAKSVLELVNDLEAWVLDDLRMQAPVELMVLREKLVAHNEFFGGLS